MKNSIKIICAVATLSMALACTDQLEERSGQLNAGDLDYTDSDDMISPLIGAYNIFATRGWEEPLLLSVRGDDVNAGGLGDQQPFSDTDMFTYNYTYWMYNSLWNLHTSDIISLNTAIVQINRYREFLSTGEEALADQYIAEIKVLRAWLQLNLTRTWGDVFIYQTNNPAQEIEENGLSSKEEVLQFISDDMDDAIQYLPMLRPNERTDLPGGVTAYTAYAIKAMANLELGNYQAVADAAGAVISSNRFSLYPDFYELFKKPGELSNESLLEM